MLFHVNGEERKVEETLNITTVKLSTAEDKGASRFIVEGRFNEERNKGGLIEMIRTSHGVILAGFLLYSA